MRPVVRGRCVLPSAIGRALCLAVSNPGRGWTMSVGTLNGVGGMDRAREMDRVTRKGRKAKQASGASKQREHAARKAERWAHWYTGTAVVLSAGLNAYAAVVESHQASTAGGVAAGAIGATIPVLVWMLGTVTAWTYRAGWKRLAMVSGAVAAAVLALSVVHVAGALAALTGTGWLLAGLFAVGIDCGLVSSEATAILVSSVE